MNAIANFTQLKGWLEELHFMEDLVQIKFLLHEKIDALRSAPPEANYLITELQQITESQSIERTRYYLRRLQKGLEEVKTNQVNDLNLNRWKEYEDIETDSLWLIPKRDNSGVHSAAYWGNFVPQIPNQLLRRFTKKGDWVLDTFTGSGTALIECNRLERNGIGIELHPEVAVLAKQTLAKAHPVNDRQSSMVVTADSISMDYQALLKNLSISEVQMLLMHPPYWDIIKFSDDPRDLSNAVSLQEFIQKIGQLIDQTLPVLQKGRFLALVIGDKYKNGEWIPLGFYAMQEVLKRKCILKSIVVKNFDVTKAKLQQQALWRYRALAGGFYVFKHEYIYLFQKK